MYCQLCGAVSQQSVCVSCSPDSTQEAPSNDVPLANSKEASIGTPNLFAAGYGRELQGVGGWLLFLCLSLTLFVPYQNLRIASKALTNLARHPIGLPTELRLASVAVVYAGLSMYSVLAGYRLWREDRKAPEFAKNYLIISTGCVISLHATLYSLGIHVGLLQVMVARLVYFAIWYSYLRRSRRVRATYTL